MDFLQAEREYLRLKARYQAGQMISSEFEKLANALMVRDRHGYVWQQGVASGKWYRYEGGKWYQDDPSEKQQPVRWAGTPIPSQPDIRLPDRPGEVQVDQLPAFPPETLEDLSSGDELPAEPQRSHPVQNTQRHVPIWVFIGIALLLLALILYFVR
ncbi:MAG: hypothetical protein HPY45_05035 [Anaerolineae bacterium]|nr:hypothetical protein [Anaerolineae bacterium]